MKYSIRDATGADWVWLTDTVRENQHIAPQAVIARMVDSLSDMRFDCDGSSQGTAANGRASIGPCIAGALAGARSAIAQARVSIERDRTLSASDRAEALRDLDEAMRELSEVD